MTKEFTHQETAEATDSDLDGALMLGRAEDGSPIFVPAAPIIARALSQATDWTETINSIVDTKIATALQNVPLTSGLTDGDYVYRVSGATKQWVTAPTGSVGTPPVAPTISDVATDNIVSVAEAAAGVTISGTAEAASTVAVSWGGVNKSTTATGGNWSVSYTSGQVPAAGATVVSATATNADGTSPTATKDVTVQSAYPTATAAPTSKPAAISLAMPGMGEVVQFGYLETSVTRLYNVSGKHHRYSTMPSFNSTNTRLILNNNGPYVLLDVENNFAVLTSNWDEDDLCFYDPVDPVLGWSQSSPNRIKSFNMETKAMLSNTVCTPASGSYTSIKIGGYEGSISNDGKYIVYTGVRTGAIDVCVFDTDLLQTVTRIPFVSWSGPNGDVDNCHISQDGQYVVVKSKRSGDLGYKLYDRATGAHIRNLTTVTAWHGAMAKRSDGSDCLVTLDNASRALISIRLSDGNIRTELSSTIMPGNFHLSGCNIQRPGYVYVSTFRPVGSTQIARYLANDLFAVKLDGSQTVERYGQPMTSSQEVYENEPHGLVNQDGTMFAFVSDWGVSGGPRYGFVCGMNL